MNGKQQSGKSQKHWTVPRDRTYLRNWMHSFARHAATLTPKQRRASIRALREQLAVQEEARQYIEAAANGETRKGTS